MPNITRRTSIACPFCQVAPGEPCIGANGRPRLSVHAERWQKRLKLARKKKAVKEGSIREALKKRVEEYGGEIRAVSWLGRKNAPDVLCLFPADSTYARHSLDSLHPFVETKRPGKDATEAQAREHERMRAAGCEVLVTTTLEELDAWLPPLPG